MLNLYITSSNRREGKTFLTAGLAATMQSLGYSTTVYKPIQTNGIERNGFMQSPDLTYVKTIDPYINTHFSYLYKSDLEPLIASELENEPIDIELISREYGRISSTSDCTLLDGDCGILSPIAPAVQTADLVKNSNFRSFLWLHHVRILLMIHFFLFILLRKRAGNKRCDYK